MNPITPIKPISFAIAAVLSFGLLSAADKSLNTPGGIPRQQLFTFNYENVLGTSLEVKVNTASLQLAEKAEGAARREIDRQAKVLSAWDPDSEFRRWMRTQGQPVRVSPELFEVLGLFDKWRERTGGALDASAEVITRLWKAAEAQDREPSLEQIQASVAEVQRAHWKLDAANRTATHLSNAPIVLNSFAKSYIVGHAADRALATPVRTIALWREKPRYIAELKAWYRGDRLRAMSEGTDLIASVSSATRAGR